MVYLIREDHPDMGLCEIYFMITPIGLGRDIFKGLCKGQGLNVRRYRNGCKITDSNGTRYFPNLLEGLELIHPNQVWQSDITFFSCNVRYLYITWMDASAKIIVVHCASSCLDTQYTTVIALKMSIKKYKDKNLEGLILHSDGGDQ